MVKTHIANFPGEDKVLYVHDGYSREEYMYKYYLGGLKKQKGYYMYYEKNEPMQAYMLKVNKPKSLEANFKDEKTQKIRTIALKGYVEEPKTLENNEKPGKANAVITTILAVAMLALAFKISTGGLNDNEPVMVPVSSTQSVAANNEATKAENKHEMTLPPKVVPEYSESTKKSGDKEDSDKENTDKENEEEKDNDNSVIAQVDETKDKATKTPAENKDDSVKGTKEPAENKEGGKTTQKTDKADTEPVINQNETTTYVVAKGDTLADISYKMYGTVFKVEAIMKANNITDKNVIVVGQKLVIPS